MFRDDSSLSFGQRAQRLPPPIRIPFFCHLPCVGEELTSRPRRGDIYIREDLAKTPNEDYLLMSAAGREVQLEITPRSFTRLLFFFSPTPQKSN